MKAAFLSGCGLFALFAAVFGCMFGVVGLFFASVTGGSELSYTATAPLLCPAGTATHTSRSAGVRINTTNSTANRSGRINTLECRDAQNKILAEFSDQYALAWFGVGTAAGAAGGVLLGLLLAVPLGAVIGRVLRPKSPTASP